MTVPDFSLEGGYAQPGQSAINFIVYLVGENPDGPSVGGTLNVSVAMAYRGASRRGARRLDTTWAGAPRRDDVAAAGWRSAVTQALQVNAFWRQALGHDVSSGGDWASAQRLQTSDGLPWGPVYPRDQVSEADWQASKAVPTTALGLGWGPVFPRDEAVVVRWKKSSLPMTKVDPYDTIVAVTPTFAQRVPHGSRLMFALLPGSPTPPNFELQRRELYDPPSSRTVHFIVGQEDGGDLVATGADPYVPATTVVLTAGYAPGELSVVLGTVPPARLVLSQPTLPFARDPAPEVMPWGQSAVVDLTEVIPWGHGPQLGPRDPPPIDIPSDTTHEPPPTPIPRQVYLIMNDASVVLLPDRTPIDVDSIDLDTSVDTWCWSLKMDLADPSQMDLLKPTAAGLKVVEITLNGYVWTMAIEGRDRTRAHVVEGGRTASVSGRSQTVLLTQDYTARRSMAVAEAISAQQLAGQEITDRQLPFTIDWSGLDWVIPGGAWSYQDLAPIDVISQIAAARGAVVQSSQNEAKLVVASRYPISPWKWSQDNADIALIPDWVVSESGQQQNKPLYDAVFVSGQQRGVQARVTREASAGETWAPQVVDALIVQPEIAAERGRVVLSDRGMQDLVTLDIPLFTPSTITASATGLYLPLMLVDVQDPDDPYQALAVAVKISARRTGDEEKVLEIWQSVSLERHLSDAN